MDLQRSRYAKSIYSPLLRSGEKGASRSTEPGEAGMSHNQDASYDVLVVGCGIAGLSAAVTAREQGASVALLERSSIEERGGNTRWTEALLRMKSESAVSDDFEDHFAKNAGHHLDPKLVNEAAGTFEDWPSIAKVLNFSDPHLVATLAEHAAPTIAWLKSLGVRFDFLPTYFITASQPRMAPVGGGLALVEALAAQAERQNVRFFYRTTARRLVQTEAGAISGIVASGPDGAFLTLRGASVVLACGGFEGNAEMLARYVGPRARYIRPVARGGYYNKGEGISMALDIGAAPCGDYSSFHAEPLDPRSGATEPVVMAINYGILVNKLGERFTDEAPATIDATYEAITRIILEQPSGIAYLILDAGIEDIANWRRAIRSDQPPIAAASMEELASKIEIETAALTRTVQRYNVACGSGPFDPFKLDGLRTDETLSPPKSNWARPISTPPFLAYPIICGNCFTFGGLKVNKHAQVLNTDGVPIRGLYAAGETMGFYYGTYTGATSVLRGAVFGRLAAKHSMSA